MTFKDADGDTIYAGATPIRVGIVGGGASGALVASRLLREAAMPMDIVIFEPRADLAKGVAYETPDPLHLLNVPACNMSALPQDADHFRRWAECGGAEFVTRSRYGEYLQSLLLESEAGAAPGVTLKHVRTAVADLGAGSRPWLQTQDGDVQEFDVVVLATGHDGPVVPGVLDGLPADRLVADPWLPGGLDGIKDGAEVLVIGTGLTFVDVSLTILHGAPNAHVHGISRFGLLPKAHEDPWRPAHPAPDLPTLDVDPQVVVEYVQSFADDWRRGIDSLRPITADLWLGMDEPARESFVLHLARHWNVHRHRMAPDVARQFDTLMTTGAISLHRASVSKVEVVGERLRADLSDGTALDVDHVVVCIGPSGDMTRNPLGGKLIESGVAQPGPLGVGYLVDPTTGELIAQSGERQSTILTIGPLRRGVLWESIAMPEVRVQAAGVAHAILAMAGRAAVPH